jgi:hypothetical protein
VNSLARRLSWALALSIGLNLFLLGFGIARAWRSHGGPPDPHGGERGRPGLARMLGPTPELRAQRQELGEARRRVAEALGAEPYQRARTEQALRELRDVVRRGQELLHRRLLERADQLTPSERRELATQRYEPRFGSHHGPAPEAD